MSPIREWLNAPAKIGVHPFESIDNPLIELSATSPQAKYLAKYLRDLGARTVMIEENYFDRDYLAEHKAFYSHVALGYPNISKRLHFFNFEFDTSLLQKTLEGSLEAIGQLQEGYLGFTVIRPIPASLGRSVVDWYPDLYKEYTPRVYGGKENTLRMLREYLSRLRD